MGARAKHQKALLMAAAKLFRRQGFQGTSTAQILALSGAPRGSLYHYFPGGKQEIGAVAIGEAGRLVANTLGALAKKASNPLEFIDLYAGELTAWLERSSFQDGCPIATTLLETAAQSEPMASEGAKAFTAWRSIIAEMLADHGLAPDRTVGVATIIISTIEGALILAKTEKSTKPVIIAASELKTYLTTQIA